AALSRTRLTAPSVRQDRKVMIAITSTIACPATLSGGTIGAARRLESRTPARAATRGLPGDGRSSAASVIDVQPSAGQNHAPRFHLLHQADIVRGDHHRGAEAVELDEQPQEPAGERR